MKCKKYKNVNKTPGNQQIICFNLRKLLNIDNNTTFNLFSELFFF